MARDKPIRMNLEVSQEFKSFEEFCSENVGRELTYLELVEQSPLDIDSITLAFSMRHLLRLSKGLRDVLLNSLANESMPSVSELLATKGIQLDKTHATCLREIVFAFRDCVDESISATFVRALQLMAVSRDRSDVILDHAESYVPPEEGWSSEDFGNDESAMEAVRSIEDPFWRPTEET